MSGGHFDYSQFTIESLARDVELEIENNNVPDEYGHKNGYGDDTLERMREAAWALKLAAIYLNRVDYLISGDDSEKSFHQSLREELRELDAETRKNNHDWRDRYMDSFCAKYIEQKDEK